MALTPQQEQQALQEFVTKYRFQRASIGGVNFWLNPDFSLDTQYLIQMKPTLGGYVRLNWGMQPYAFQLAGTTGTTGIKGLQLFDQFRPLFGATDPVYEFRYPGRLKGSWQIHINDVKDNISKSYPLYWFYTIDAMMMPPTVQSVTSVTGGAGTYSIPNPVINPIPPYLR